MSSGELEKKSSFPNLSLFLSSTKFDWLEVILPQRIRERSDLILFLVFAHPRKTFYNIYILQSLLQV